MQREQVNGSRVISVGYDSDTYTLEVQLVEGQVLQFLDVPPDVYDDLINITNPDSYFEDEIESNYSVRHL